MTYTPAVKPNEHVGHNAVHMQYGLTCSEFDEMVIRSQGRCARCGRSMVFLMIDHDHLIGWTAVRGLICTQCNTIVSYVERGQRVADSLTTAYLATPYHLRLPIQVPQPRKNQRPASSKPSIDPQLPALVSLTGAGEILGVKRAQAHRLLMDGKLPGAQVDTSGNWVFRREVIEAIAAKRSK